jgi:hypothetical protein
MSNTVEVQSTGQVLVSETSEHAIEVQVPSQPALVEVTTAGPQGAPGFGIPPGGAPGNVLIKSTNADYVAGWAATVDGGTFN